MPESRNLQQLLHRQHFYNDLPLATFKIEAMRLMRLEADPTLIFDDGLAQNTLIHYFINTHQDGQNLEEIKQLLAHNATFAVAKNGNGLTPLQYVMNLYVENKMPLAGLKELSQLLLNFGADLKTVNDCLSGTGSLLHYLIKTNLNDINTALINEFLQKDAELVSVKNKHGETALKALMVQNQRKATPDFKKNAMILALAGSDLTVVDNGFYKNTLLHHLIETHEESASMDELKKLLDLNRDLVQLKSGNNLTLLQHLLNLFVQHCVSLPKLKELAFLLLSYGADAKTLSNALIKSTSLLYVLVETNVNGVNDKEITELLKNPELIHVKDGKNQPPLQALLNQHLQSTLPDFKKNAMRLALAGSDLSLVDNSLDNNTFFHHLIKTHAAASNYDEIEQLLKFNPALANIKNGNNLTPIQYLMNLFIEKKMSAKDFKKISMLLVNHQADLKVFSTKDKKPYTLLHCLVEASLEDESVEEIKQLLSLDAGFINIGDAKGYTPLQTLLANNEKVSPEYVTKLVNLGANIHQKSSFGEILIHFACLSGNLDCVKVLMGAGLDVLAKTNIGQTALHYAISNHNQELWQWLIDHGVGIDVQDSVHQYTALHLAIRANNIPAATWLLSQKARIDLVNKDGDTPLAFAQKINQGVWFLNVLSRFYAIDQINPQPENISPPRPSGPQMPLTPDPNQVPEIPDPQQEPSPPPPPPADNRSKIQLFDAIEDMYNYGVILHDQDSAKGQVAIDLANDLKSMATEFYRNNTPLDQFKQAFTTLLTSQNDVMSQYRVSWSTIIANVAIALTGIGALCIVGQLCYSKLTIGRALFFFQKEQTTCEKKIAAVDTCLSVISV